jgi:dihydroorotate dehydrogenase/NAD-dependent dihydropyrimidine dehydrogenase PreA subunit
MSFNPDDVYLPVEVGGVTFRNPCFVGSGPTAKSVSQLVLANEWGWAGASIKLTFDPEPYVSLEPRYGWWKKEEFLAFSAETRLTYEQGMELIEEARKVTEDFVIMANVTYIGDKPGVEGWVDMARNFESAGAHVIELNMCCPNMSFNVELSGTENTAQQTGASLGQNAEALGYITKAVKDAVGVPVFVKLTPEGGRIAQVAKACFDAGADAVGGTANRLAIPPFDIANPKKGPYALQAEPSMSCFSGPWINPLGMRDTYEIRKLVGATPIVTASGGLMNAEDIIRMAMCGGDLMCICTATMLKGFEFLPALLKDVKTFMAENGYNTWRDMRDLMVESITPATELTIEKGHARKTKIDEACKIAPKCGLCKRICTCEAVDFDGDLPVIDKDKCHACGMCVQLCPLKNFEMVKEQQL